MKNISEMDPNLLSGLVGIFTDIDDTLSSAGKLTADAFAALWQLHDAGIKTIVVTGRPAGWCDHIARFWPVTAVVGENGGFYFHHDGNKLGRYYLYNNAERAEFRKKLESVRDKILKTVHGASVASDQSYREYDIAIDFCEDVPRLPQKEVMRIKTIFEDAGANAKISSIHVNGWYGEFDKLTTSIKCAKDLLGVDVKKHPESFVYCGDSPNDEPMFAFFPLSVGMANIQPFVPMLKSLPSFVTNKACGAGFREVANVILQAQSQ
ncbi:MAG: HAD-IIB family hydrolase [Lentisphaerae bacterium]|nr:HAD-IIB family hydrolase [Lentisphaerota bacterium]